MKKITIAIDGFAGTGKSTTAKRVAKELDYIYIDSGAMYRAVTLYFLRKQVDFSEEHEEMKTTLSEIRLGFSSKEEDPIPQIVLNEEFVESEIRSPKVSENVSKVAVHGVVREAMVNQQRKMGASGGVVMDGRDIGTVVFPGAELKVFVTAEMSVRAHRRMRELHGKGVDITLESVIQNLRERDHIDANREIAPLIQADDAVEIDTTNMTIDQQVSRVVELARERMRIHNVD